MGLLKIKVGTVKTAADVFPVAGVVSNKIKEIQVGTVHDLGQEKEITTGNNPGVWYKVAGGWVLGDRFEVTEKWNIPVLSLIAAPILWFVFKKLKRKLKF